MSSRRGVLIRILALRSLRNENTLAAFNESMQGVTTVVSGRSLKCNAIFAVWIFAVVDLFSRVDTSHFQYVGTPC